MPTRTCVACRRRAEQGELLRWTVDERGVAWPDGRRRRPARGAYLCRTEACWEEFRRRARKRGPDLEGSEEAFRLAIRGGRGENAPGEKLEN
ncbi:MAG: DUF448 domain-containing protein [bacterium]